MIKSQMFIAVALLVGVAIGYFVKNEPVVSPEPEMAEVSKRSVADKGETASIKALRRRLAELEKLLAEKDGESELAISNAVAEAVKARPPEPPRQNWRERMEEMKKNDPERYAQTTNRWAQWRRNRAERAKNTMDFLSSIDTSHMNAGARKTHGELQALLVKREEIEEQLQQEDLTDEQRRALWNEMRTTNGELWRQNGRERKNLLDEVARSLGFSGEDAEEVTATIQEVIEATESGWGGPHRGGRRGGPGGR